MVNSQSLSLKTAEAGFTGTFTRSSALWRSRTKNQRHQSRQRLPLNSSVPGSTASGGRRSSSIRCRSSPPEQRNAGCCGSMTSSGTHSCRASLKTRPFPFPQIRSSASDRLCSAEEFTLLCRRNCPRLHHRQQAGGQRLDSPPDNQFRRIFRHHQLQPATAGLDTGEPVHPGEGRYLRGEQGEGEGMKTLIILL